MGNVRICRRQARYWGTFQTVPGSPRSWRRARSASPAELDVPLAGGARENTRDRVVMAPSGRRFAARRSASHRRNGAQLDDPGRAAHVAAGRRDRTGPHNGGRQTPDLADLRRRDPHARTELSASLETRCGRSVICKHRVWPAADRSWPAGAARHDPLPFSSPFPSIHCRISVAQAGRCRGTRRSGRGLARSVSMR
jgi:hypothetical protein